MMPALFAILGLSLVAWLVIILIAIVVVRLVG